MTVQSVSSDTARSRRGLLPFLSMTTADEPQRGLPRGRNHTVRIKVFVFRRITTWSRAQGSHIAEVSSSLCFSPTFFA